MCVYVDVYTPLLIHSSAHGRLGGFHVSPVVNSAAVNIGVCASFWTRDLSSICPGVGVLDHVVILFLVF